MPTVTEVVSLYQFLLDFAADKQTGNFTSHDFHISFRRAQLDKYMQNESLTPSVVFHY